MHTLYIHGLDSSPKPAKMKAIERFSPVSGLHLNYREQKDAFRKLCQHVEEMGITHLIGSSMGGYLGFYLAHTYGLPCLLFNPALASRSVEVPVELNHKEVPRRLIVLGMLDQVVNPGGTLGFLSDSSFPANSQEIILNRELAHQIPQDVFEKGVNYFFGADKNHSFS